MYEGDMQSAPPLVRADVRLSLGRIAVRLESAAPGPFVAIEEAIPILDRLLESISFQMQASATDPGRSMPLTCLDRLRSARTATLVSGRG